MTTFPSSEAQTRFTKILDQIPSPCFVLDETLFERNLKILSEVKEKSGATIFLALKGWAMWSVFPLAKKYLDGVCASSPNEARLGREEFGKEVCSFGPGYSEADLQELTKYSNHIIFNSFSQWKRFRDIAPKNVNYGIRVNPGYSEIETDIWNPCVYGSRLGCPFEAFDEEALEGISGLHFHALCAQGAETLQRVAESFEKLYGKYLSGMKWINMGGGHYITQPGYNIDLLCDVIRHFQEKYNLEVIIEPGEANVFDTGYLVSTVLDTMKNGMDIAILDVSASNHLPDVLSSQYAYRPEIIGASMKKGEKPYPWRLGGPTCLAGDSFRDYFFDAPLQVGQKIIFRDMMQYNMVQATAFNGVRIPSIGILRKDGNFELVREFEYEDYKGRLS